VTSREKREAAAAFQDDFEAEGGSPDDPLYVEASHVSGRQPHVIKAGPGHEGEFWWVLCECGYRPRTKSPENLILVYAAHINSHKAGPAITIAA
jgi:hypothetical protein